MKNHNHLALFCAILVLLILLPIAGLTGDVHADPMAGVRNVGFYQQTNWMSHDGRNATQLLAGMDADFVMRGWFKSVIESPNWFVTLQNSISELKAARPSIIYEGGISASTIISGDTYADGTAISPADFSCMQAKDVNGNPITHNAGYLSDLACPAYQTFLTGWCERQIDAGVDALFFDEVYTYAGYKIRQLGADPASTYNQYEGYFASLVSTLKSYASSKSRSLLVTTNGGYATRLHPTSYDVTYQAQDFLTFSIGLNDFVPPFNLQENWAQLKQTLGLNLPIMAFIDFSNPGQDTAMTRFAKLSTQDQITVLKEIDAATRAAGVLFAYPIFLAHAYDATAAGTYDTIVSLARSSASATSSTASVSQATQTSTVSSQLTTAPIPGFPWESIITGLALGLAALALARRRGKRQVR